MDHLIECSWIINLYYCLILNISIANTLGNITIRFKWTGYGRNLFRCIWSSTGWENNFVGLPFDGRKSVLVTWKGKIMLALAWTLSSSNLYHLQIILTPLRSFIYKNVNMIDSCFLHLKWNNDDRFIFIIRYRWFF